MVHRKVAGAAGLEDSRDTAEEALAETVEEEVGCAEEDADSEDR